ncbi:MAG: hypothetical protein UR54_C0010G0009 [Candidatus Roizmanbacteria bacterium GW2011_GWA2_34_18]|uniref:Uncharacterized protein n=1 Tax=Candidatus Roizmanbacteria bacterium GW2011_GWA2_34_18 TaxID=1618477 RepID=A0A0G0BA26_9BACT|nr:MAG: hypothetical protein UR54_C0010G0009 [Candidatus Roizmanbacteria bacterium GW2011_GWA2_34_18]
MGPNTPEQPPRKNMQEQARATAEQIIADMRANHQSEVARINLIKDDNERLRARALLEQQEVEKIRSKMSEQIRDAADTSQADRPEDKQKKAEKAKHIFLEAKALGDEGVKVGDAKSQQVVNKIVEYMKNGQITDEGALVLERNIGKDLLNGIVFSKPGEPPSTFEKNLRIAYESDPIATAPLLRDLGENQDVFGYEGTPQDLLNKIGMDTPESDPQKALTPEQQQMIDEAQGENSPNAFVRDKISYYQSRFTGEQLNLIEAFYSPEKFVDYMEHLSDGDDNGGKNFLKKAEVQERKQEIEHHIKEYYNKNNRPLSEGELKDQVEKHWGEEVSEMMNWKVSDIINQLFLELQQKSPHKFYEQIMQEDIFQGPAMIQKRIQTAINSLMTKVDQIEGKDTELAKRIKNLKLYRHAVKPHVIEERSKDPNDPNKNIYPRVKPIPYGESIGLGEFIEYVNMTIDHTIHKTEFFHNSRAIYKHPPGEKGFYHQLGEFAEQLQGTDIEEILLLPDGQYVLEAYQLYEKMLQEDFAQMDHRHRPDQLTNKLERVNSEIEEEVIEQLRAFYPDLTRQRIKNIVNNAVGISRGMFLTEAEQSAYADPVDSEGKGMVASYSTNDAGSLNAFNPMHTIMRWQGEHNFNSMYFMPVHGEQGAWDHNKAWKNMAKYMDSFYVGKGRGKGKDGLPEEVFADSMMNIGKIGGPGIRKGWRTHQALEGHYVYDEDGTIDAPNTFQAMEAIGYEAIYNFVKLKQAGPGLMKATEKTDPDQVKERRELFKYIYKKYFYDGDPQKYSESEFDNYITSLKEKGKDEAIEKVESDKSLSSGSEQGGWQAKSLEEEIEYQTSNLFLDNMLAHYVAARFPTKFLRIDKNRLHSDGISNWQKIWREFREKGWQISEFDHAMKDLNMAEMLFRRQISGVIREQIRFDPDWRLDKIDEIKDLPWRLNEDKIKELLSENHSEDKNRVNKEFKNQKDIDRAVEVYRQIIAHYKNTEFLDGEGIKQIKKFKFTFGLEDTDLSLMAFRGTGPRMAARAIKDTGSIEQHIIPWIIQMPLLLNEIAISGKHDFEPIIKYMREAQRAITDINGVPDTYEFIYKLAGTVINYFKRDGMAKPLFGLFRLGQKNSIAAEYAGRSSAVWEWDSRDIDRFCVALESNSLLKNSPYNLQAVGNEGKFSGGKLEDRWIKIPGLKKPIRFGKKRHVDYEFDSLKLRKEHGGDIPAIAWDYVNQFLPLAMAFLLWKYIKDAMDEASGKKKQ